MKNTNTKQETKSVEETVNKISVLHLAKLQESDQEINSINQQAVDLHYQKLEVSQREAALNNFTNETLFKRDSLLKELKGIYGTLNIDSETGEIKEIATTE